MSIKVLGAGFGRTGTTSLRSALEELGFGPCYHVYQLFKDPSEIEFWENLYQGKEVDFDSFFTNYQAVFGFPGYYFYRQLMENFPKSVVILSYTDPDKWYEDAANTIFSAEHFKREKEDAKIVRQNNPFIADCLDRIYDLEQSAILNGYFQGRFKDKKYTIIRFKQRIEEVKKVVPPERLLVYEIEQGWKPLCEFLDVPVPDKLFPHLNHPSSFQSKRKKITDNLQKL